MTHAELVGRAGLWLRRMGCSIVFEELVALTGEIPDAIGWRGGGRLSFLVECKASRGDFFADAKKAHRDPEARAMGCYRYFMCSPGMIRVDELPARWGLLYAHASKVTVEAGRHPRNWGVEGQAYYHKPSREGELAMVLSALNRLRLDLGDNLWRERVHRSYTERQSMRESVARRRLIFDNASI